jgi:hypothetical protein
MRTSYDYRGFTIESERDGTLSVYHPAMHYCGGGYKTVEQARKRINQIRD